MFVELYSVVEEGTSILQVTVNAGIVCPERWLSGKVLAL